METKKSEPAMEPIELTQEDRQMIIFALGHLMGGCEMEADRKLSPMARAALRLAGKFGVSYE